MLIGVGVFRVLHGVSRCNVLFCVVAVVRCYSVWLLCCMICVALLCRMRDSGDARSFALI